MSEPRVTVTIRGVVAIRLTDYAARNRVSLEQAARELVDAALARLREEERIASGRPLRLTYGGLEPASEPRAARRVEMG